MNKLLVGQDVFKHSQKLADININKALKKRSLLEEIQKMYGSSDMHSGGSTSGKPIIVVPASAYPGNISLVNAVSFLRDGKFID